MTTSPLRALSAMTSAMLGLLSLQYLLGIISSLYVTFPDTTDQAQLWHAANTHWPTLGHMIVGTVIVLLGIIILIKGVQSKNSMFSTLAIIGFVMLLVAAIGGEEFVKTQKDMYTLVMGFGFIVSMGIYGRLLAALLVTQSKEPQR